MARPSSGPDPRRILRFPGTRRLSLAYGRRQYRRSDCPSCRARNATSASPTTFKWCGLAGLRESLSFGSIRRHEAAAEVARALAVNPDMLFLDEPFGALDSITRLIMRGELLRIWQTERRTIIFVTHDIDEAVQLADRVVVLSSRPAKIQAIRHHRHRASARHQLPALPGTSRRNF